MKNVKNILKYIASGFLVLLVMISVYTFVATDIMKKDYANIFGYTYFVVASGSMSSAIEVDDIVFVKITDKVSLNDIITYKSDDGAIITHRLISMNNNKYVLKGDANNMADEPINKGQIIGKVSLVVSPSFILKSIAIFLILFIFLALINFDGIVKKYIVKDTKMKEKLPDDLFSSPKKNEDPSSGLTVTISFSEMEELNKRHEEEIKKEESIEILDEDEYLDDPDENEKNNNSSEKDTIDLVVSILKCKKNHVQKARMNKKWVTKYQYVYKLCFLALNRNTSELVSTIEHPTFTEIYDYDLERVGLTETIRNRIYDCPLHVFLRLLTYSILYNDDEMFDGIYKILKYKVLIDNENRFKTIKKSDTYSIKQIKTLIEFMKKVSNRFDNKHVFELDKIERMIKIKSY